MGSAKNEMMRLEDLQAVASAVLVQADALKPCGHHEDILINQDDPDATARAYAIGTNRVKAGEVDGTREELMAAIKSVLENSFNDCPYPSCDTSDD